MEEVDFNPGSTPLFVGGEQGFRADRRDVFRIHPEDEFHAFGCGVGHEGGHVDVRQGLDGGLRIAAFLIIPEPIDEHVGPAHLGGEVDEILVGLRVAAGVKTVVLGPVGIATGPPDVPSGDAGFDPRSVCNLGWRGQIAQHGGNGEITGVAADDQRVPWRLARGLRLDLGDERGLGSEGTGFAGRDQHRAGPIARIDLGHGDDGIRGLDDQGQDAAVAGHLVEADFRIEALRIRAAADPCAVVAGEEELGEVARHGEWPRARGLGKRVAQGHAVVVGADMELENHRCSRCRAWLAEPDTEFAVLIAHRGGFSKRILPGRVMRLHRGGDGFRLHANLGATRQS